MAVGERFITPELQHLEARILTATEHSQQLEYELFCALRRWVADQGDRLRRVADLLANMDALVSLAEVAAGSGWQRPEVTEAFGLQIAEGRHPTVEISGASFVPNDLELTPERFLLVVTGPNMAGKSTYARQAALLIAVGANRQLHSSPGRAASASSIASSRAWERLICWRAACPPLCWR